MASGFFARICANLHRVEHSNRDKTWDYLFDQTEVGSLNKLNINISGKTTDIILQLYYAWRAIGSSKSYFNSEHSYFIEIIGMRFPQWK